MVYCHYSSEDSVTEIGKFDLWGPDPINIELLIIARVVNILKTPL